MYLMPESKRNWTRAAVVLMFVAAILALAGCNKEGKPKPSKMMGPLYSYQSLQAVQRQLDMKPNEWTVLEDRRPLSTDKRPPFRMLTITRKNFLQWQNAGELQMTFYNDRLMIVRFYPMNIEMFKNAVAAEDGVAFSGEGDAWIDPSTRVWVGKDADGRIYVGWIDKALQTEMDQWLKQYS